MNSIEKKNLEEKTIVGIIVRTSPKTAAKDIGALWGRFYGENLIAHIPAKNQILYSIYYDYESDSKGAYTTLLGVETVKDVKVPSGMQKIVIPAGNYAVFSFAGNPGSIVYEAWNEINGYWSKNAVRTYLVDFECYKSISKDACSGEIWVGVSP